LTKANTNQMNKSSWAGSKEPLHRRPWKPGSRAQRQQPVARECFF